MNLMTGHASAHCAMPEVKSKNAFLLLFLLLTALFSGGLAAPRSLVAAPGDITTIAGGGVGDAGPALSASLDLPREVYVTPSGVLYIADTLNHRVRKIDINGIITTVAGNGIPGFSGDGGPAISASLKYPMGVVVDGAGNLFIADAHNARVRKVDTSGNISTVIGGGTEKAENYCSLPAAEVGSIVLRDIFLDSSDRIHVSGGSLWRLETDGTMVNVSDPGCGYGSFESGFSSGFFDTAGAFIYAGGSNIFKTTDMHNSVLIGAFPAFSLDALTALSGDASGSIYIAVPRSNIVHKLDASGTLTVFAGTGSAGYSGEGGYAFAADLNDPTGVQADASGNLYIADRMNHRIRKVDPNGIITTVAGSGEAGYAGNGSSAASDRLNIPRGVFADVAGNVYIADTYNHRIRKIDPAGVMTTIAGNGVADFSGDNGPASAAGLSYPTGLFVRSDGTIYVADSLNARIRKIDPTGTITTIAGTDDSGYAGDGGPATEAVLSQPNGVIVDNAGNVFIADPGNNSIRKIDPSGIISTYANIIMPRSIAFDSSGVLYVATGLDGVNRVYPDRTVDLLPSCPNAASVFVDSVDTIYVACQDANMILQWRLPDEEQLLAGTGAMGFSGDNGPAVAAMLNSPGGVFADAYGIYIADSGNDRIRRIAVSPEPTVVIRSPQGITGNPMPLLSFTVNKGTPVVTVDGFVVNKLSGENLDPLADGPHTVRVESDYQGNIGSAETSFTVDTVPPSLSIDPVTSPTGTMGQVLSGTRESNAAITVITSPPAANSVLYYPTATTWVYTIIGLAEGTNDISVTARDAAGNKATVNASIVVDVTPPTVSIQSPVAGLTNNTTPLLNYTVSDGTITVKVDGVVVSKVSGATLENFNDGQHLIRVESTDVAGNTGFAEVVFTVDTLPPSAVQVSRIAAGGYHTIVLKTDGSLWGWGQNTDGQVGDYTCYNKSTPVRVGNSTTWTAISAGFYHSVGMRSDGTLWAWGNGLNGQLGTGYTDDVCSPVQIGTDTAWSSFAAGGYHSAAIKSNGTLWAWGYNGSGAVGDGTIINRLSPVQVTSETNWAAVSTGFMHTVALKKDGTLWAWGYNSYGQLGIGNNISYKTSPQKIGVDTTWRSVSASGFHTVALKADGTLWAWGFNESGQLGDGSTTDKNAPVQIGNETSWVLVSTGNDYTVALKSDGTFWSWGKNANGQLGDGSTINKPEPVRIGVENGWRLISAGGYHTLSSKSDGTVWGWGDNTYGQLGDGTAEAKSYPVKIVNADALFINSGTIFANTMSVTLTFKVVDVNGVAEMRFSNDGSTWTAPEPYATTKDWTLDAGDGTKTVFVKFKDNAGNWSSVFSDTIALDTVAPVVVVSSPVAGVLNTVNPLLTYTVSEGTVVVKVDGAVVSKVSGNILGPLTQGSHTVRVDATDAAGNSAYDQSTFTVDTVVPTISLTSPVSGMTVSNQPLLSYTVNEGIVTVKVDGDIVGKVSGETLGPLTEGLHVVRVEAVDAAGNSNYVERTITVDTIAPTVAIASPASGTTNDNTPLLMYTVSEGGVTVKVDGVVVNTPSGSALAVLSNGLHTVRVDSVDAAGNAGFAEVSFVIDAVFPAVTIESPASGLTNVNTPLLGYTVNDGSVSVLVDGVAVATRSGDALDLLSDGTHTIRVVSTDTTGNQGYAEVMFSVDTTPPLQAMTAIAAGSRHSVILRSDGSLWASGRNDEGQLGDGTVTRRLAPVPAGRNAAWASIHAGYNHTIATRTDGTLWAWGLNYSGQLGDSTWVNRNVPVQVGNDTTWARITAGVDHTIGLRSDGTLWAWGSNYNGQVGDGTKIDRNAPVKIGTNTTWATVAAGGYHTLALRSNGTLWSWGANWLGQLGDGTTTEKTSPGQIGSAAVWTAAAAGYDHSLALRSDGSLWAWGSNVAGQLGDGTNVERTSPVRIGTASNWVSIAAGFHHSLALRSDGTLWAWGWNFSGQLGDGTTNSRSTPAQVGTENDWVSIHAGNSYTFAVKSDGSLWAWGDNGEGELRMGTAIDQPVPTMIEAMNRMDINNEAAYAGSADVVVNALVNDVSGIAEMQFSNDGTTWSAAEQYVPSKSWTLAPGDGTKTVYARFKDNAGNWSAPFSDRIVLDTVAPSVVITSPAAGITNASSPVFTYTVSDGTIVVKLDGAVVNKVSGNTLGPLSEGPHTVRIEATDAAGNAGSAEVSFTVDVPPTVSLTSPAAGYATSATPLLTYTVSNGTVVVKVDGAVVNKVSDNTLDALSQGLHTVRVEATDTGGTGFAERNFTVDSIVPVVVISSPTATTYTDNQPMLSYTASDSTITVKLDGVVVNTISGQRLAALTNGAHLVRVEARDAAGNISSAEVAFTVAAASAAAFSDDLENGVAKWQSNSGLWHVVTGTSPYPGSHSPSHSWWYGQDTTGDYSTGGTNSGEIVSTGFVVPAGAQLTFWSWEQTEGGSTYDTRKVYLSTNNGVSWTQIYQSTDTSAAWRQVTIDLASYALQNVQLKFSFNSVDGGINTYRGWYVDDVSVAGQGNPSGGGAALEDFETGTLTRIPWVTTGNGVWSVQSATKHTGLYAAAAPASIIDSQSAALEVAQNCAAGNMTFWYSVSSEANYDYLLFYVDGVLKGQWAGTVSWTQASYALTAGTHTFKWVYSKDGSVSSGSDIAWIDDIVIPGTVTLPTVTLSSPAVGSTNNRTPSLTYSVSSGVVVVKIDGVAVNKTTGDTLDALADGSHVVRVEATDVNGTGFAQAAFVVDTSAPAVVISSPVPGPTKINSPVLAFTMNDGTAVVKVDGIVVNKVSGNTLDALTDGSHTVRVESTDAAGNTGFAEVSFTVDATAPTVNIASPFAGITNDNHPILTYTVSDGTVSVNVDGVVVGTSSGSALDALAEGTHTVRVESTDNAGNIGFAETTFTIDTTAPTVSIASPVTGATNNNRPALAYSVSDGTVVVKVDGIVVPKVSGGTLDMLGEGAHTVRVESTDAAGNLGFSEVIFTVDTIVPVIDLSLPVAGATKNNTPLLTYTVSDGTVIVKVDSTIVSKISGNDLDALIDGTHTLRVESTDAAGNVSFAETTFVVDTVPPAISIDPVTTPMNVSSKTISGSRESGAIVVVALNTTATAGAISYPNDTAWSCTISGLVEGINAITVTATDAVGNSAAAQASLTYDSVMPTVTISLPSVGNTNNSRPVLAYTVSDGTVVVKVDGAVVQKVSGNTLDTLLDGVHVVRVESTDQAGNTGAAEVSFTIDTSAPSVVISSPVAGITKIKTPLLSYSVSDGTVVVKVDGVTVPKVSGSSLDALADGSHTVRVESIDAAGNTGFAQVTFTIDSIAPAVSISPVVSPTNNGSQTISGARENDAAVVVFVNTGAPVGPVVYPTAATWSCAISGLAAGTNTVTVTATDIAGNSAVAETSITLDSIAPVVTIASPASGPTNNRTPLLSYTVSDGTVVVKVDGTVVDKVSGNNLDALADGSHTVRVDAIDLAGNTGSASITFTVDTIAPTITMKSVTSPTRNKTQTVSGTRTNGSTVTVRANTSASIGTVSYPSSTTWSCTVSNMVSGVNTITATAADAANNTASASRSITVR